MNVAGPYTTFAGFSSAMSRHTGGRLPSPFLLSGTLPPRQPSSRSSRLRSAVSTVRVSSPCTSTRIASSPKSLLEALRVLEALRAAVHERLRGRARLEPQRERGTAQREHRGQPKHQQWPPRHRQQEASKRALDHAVSLGEPVRPPTAVARGAGSSPPARSRRPSGACGSHGGAFPRFVSPPKMNWSIWEATSGRDELVGLRRGRRGPARAEVAAEHLEVALGPELVVPARLGVRVRAVRAQAERPAGHHLRVHRVRRAQVVEEVVAVR